ncbi:nitrite/sulfite reductase [Entomobacter blattae]|uniref:Sulfite reductase n=1 Tax=Entomobacter blattae TaxID=2762277 RepID=A0A7H1NTW0_9PROT|nr:nitrite/sulfite reductase [Entomobacter blattae]QNT79220.1 Sulfite reductase [Entomobacter blattae]
MSTTPSPSPHSPQPVGPLKVGHYQYDTVDRAFLYERINQFRDLVQRRFSGTVNEDEFKLLRQMNGVYLQLHAYMLRIGVPYGVMDSDQLRVLAYIARHYDRDYFHFTTRQNVQFNWISLDDIPEILEKLAETNLHTIQTSGNCIRNVTSDEFAGAAADELIDPRVHAEILRQWSTLHPEFSFLPRKFKIAISGSPNDRVAARFHDIGIVARPNPNGGRPIFSIHAGGGMGRTPLLGIKMRDDLPEAHLLAYLEAIVRVYNAYGRRDNAFKARLKILVQALGAEKFREAVHQEFSQMALDEYVLPVEIVEAIRSRFGTPDLTAPEEAPQQLKKDMAKDPAFALWVETNTHPHHAPGRISAVISLKPTNGIPGDVTSEQADILADLAETYSFGELRVTHMQNVVLGHVRQDQLYTVWKTLAQYKLDTPNIGLIGDIICCPGLDYCVLANARSIPIAKKISQHFSNVELQKTIGPISVNISGCINACGHHHAGNIGILGVDKKGVEYFQLTLGGAADNDAAVGQILGASLPEDEAVTAISRIIDTYLSHRKTNEKFIDTYKRIGANPFKEAVYATA